MPGTTLTLATFNIWHKLDGAGLGPETFDNLHDLLAAPGLAAAGLQEIVGNIDEADLPAGWDVWQPGRHPDDRADREARKDPIVHRADLTILERGTRRISDRIENSAGSVAGRHGTWIVTPEWALVTCHLNAGLEGPPGHPVQIPRQREHEQGLNTLVDIADDLQAKYDVPVVVVGDFNVDFGADKRVQHPEFPYAIFTAAGFTCCWEGQPEDSTRTAKPNLGRTIDQLWVRGTAAVDARFVGDVRTPDRWAPGDPIESDHLPVIADVELTPRRVEAPREESDVTDWFISRDQWGATRKRPTRSSHPIGRTKGITAHWEGPGMGGFPHSRCARKVRAIERFHEVNRGWSGIAYSAIVCPHGYVFEGRGPGVKSAANGYTAVNDAWYAVCYLGGVGDDFTDPGKAGFLRAFAWLTEKGDAGPRRNGHRDHKATACPGDQIYRWVHSPAAHAQPEEDDMPDWKELMDWRITDREKDMDVGDALRAALRAENKLDQLLTGGIDADALAEKVAAKVNASVQADADVVKKAVKDALREGVE